MDTLELLGYELRIFARVPDLGMHAIDHSDYPLTAFLGDGMDRERYKDKGVNSKKPQSSPVKGAKPTHSRRISGSNSADSGLTTTNTTGSAHQPGSTPPTRVKYREQGVDELLQLKLHQAIAAADDVPDGSTIVLATGDGNTGQFNEEGFIGQKDLSVSTAHVF